jgi:hypothetical protein
MTGAAVVTSAASSPAFEQLRWTAPGFEHEELSKQPATCLVYEKNRDGIPQDTQLISGGKALFNTPTLLGGQAAKAGLSCASCHANGRVSPLFQLSGVSDRVGRADVTNSFFSASKSNGQFDPVLIPDLAISFQVSRDPENEALERFIRDLIVDEFSGEEPTANALTAIAAYVRAIRICSINGPPAAPRQLSDQTALIKDALLGRQEMLKLGDDKSAQLMIAAARRQLQLINERYAGPALADERNALLSASKELRRISTMTDSIGQDIALNSWQRNFDRGLLPRLNRKEHTSLYNPELLAKHYPPLERATSKP